MSNDILEEFIFDSREHLANADTQLLALEKAPHSLDDLNALMGTLHTIKGNSGFVNLKNLYNLLHASETLLQTVRETPDHFCPPSVIEQLFQVLDTAECIMDRLESGESDEVDWLSALNQALKEAEAALEAGTSAESASEVGSATGAESPADEIRTVRPEGSPSPAAIGPVVILGNGQLAEEGLSFLDSCQAARELGQTGLVLDLTELSQFSSEEMDLLLAVQKAYGSELAVVLDQDVQTDFYRVLTVLGLDNLFRLYPDRETALASLGGG
ncbi:MAG: Hpt domain-containing protein [Deltaproteobacteria bacterium]|jgi:chemotaxis protein histidine kinase CheA|nr:Hpt domain-containing protein [Deltaproteobacteria bacterium]